MRKFAIFNLFVKLQLSFEQCWPQKCAVPANHQYKYGRTQYYICYGPNNHTYFQPNLLPKGLLCEQHVM